jgi:hypothetical protein
MKKKNEDRKVQPSIEEENLLILVLEEEILPLCKLIV